MSIEIQCMTEKLPVIVITIKLDYSKVPSKSTVPTYGYIATCNCFINSCLGWKYECYSQSCFDTK